MTIISQMVTPSFRGVPFLFVKSSVKTGRKTKTYEYPGQNKRVVIDLGLEIKTFTIEGSTSGSGADYYQKKKSFLTALETKGLGKLIHPTEGSFFAACKSVTYTEKITELNICTFNMVFEVTQNLNLPSKTGSPRSSSGNRQPDLIDKARESFIEKYHADAKKLAEIAGRIFG